MLRNTRTFESFDLPDSVVFKQKMLNWLRRFNIFCLLDGCGYPDAYHRYDWIAGAGAHQHVVASATDKPFEDLAALHSSCGGWLLGHLAYDLKNSDTALHSAHPDTIGFSDLHFFEPEILLLANNGVLQIGVLHGHPQDIWQAIMQEPETVAAAVPASIGPFSFRFSEADYLQKVRALQQHIKDGDCYEINFCREGWWSQTAIDPYVAYDGLTARSPAPFSALYRYEDRYLVSASPERFMQKNGDEVIAQPIKGTIRRDANPQTDLQLKTQLFHSEKDRAENVMIVDLMRNDLAIHAVPGSVQVTELFGIYSFPQVHQMISTIKATLRTEAHWSGLLQHAFPMGSMTGAPKRRVMELVETYEASRRGLYSGSVGYITPAGDFDFNVVIRSLQYDSQQQVLSFQTGGAITFDSDPEGELQESLLKAQALRDVVNGLAV